MLQKKSTMIIYEVQNALQNVKHVALEALEKLQKVQTVIIGHKRSLRSSKYYIRGLVHITGGMDMMHNLKRRRNKPKYFLKRSGYVT